ncbi:MAG: OmpA family protein [Pirellulales bacterium]|nr:OmpA family protein [Pirellulales bacterium]
MRRIAWTAWSFALGLTVLAGCSNNSMVMKGQLEGLQQQQAAVARQAEQLQARASSLDRDNQELERLLAQVRQQNKVLEDQLTFVREQLGGVTSQLARVQDEKTATDQKAQALTASMKRRGGVSINPNNSSLQTLPAPNLPGTQVRRDGDVIRVELAASSLFEPGTVRLRPDAPNLASQAAAEVLRLYPDRIIGVEGHIESDPNTATATPGGHQFSIAQAMAVYEVLVSQARVPAKQLFVVGHGGNHPVVSNATLEGRQRNRRVELVVYPDQVAR